MVRCPLPYMGGEQPGAPVNPDMPPLGKTLVCAVERPICLLQARRCLEIGALRSARLYIHRTVPAATRGWTVMLPEGWQKKAPIRGDYGEDTCAPVASIAPMISSTEDLGVLTWVCLPGCAFENETQTGTEFLCTRGSHKGNICYHNCFMIHGKCVNAQTPASFSTMRAGGGRGGGGLVP